MGVGGLDSLQPLQQVQAVQPVQTKSETAPEVVNKKDVSISNEKSTGLNVTDDSNPKVSKEQVDKAVDQANKTMETFQTNLCFKLHERTKEYYVQVINSDTQEVIREIPSKKMLDMVADIEKMLGWIVDKFV